MEEEHGELEINFGYPVPAVREDVGVEYKECGFDAGFGYDILVNLGAIQTGADAPLQVFDDDLMEELIFILPELQEGSGMVLFEVIEHERVGIFQHLFEGFQGEEDLVDGIGGCIAEITAFQFVTLNFLFYYRGNHIIFIGEELVDGLFGNAQLGGYFVHGDGPDAVAAEEVCGFVQYAFFDFHFY